MPASTPTPTKRKVGSRRRLRQDATATLGKAGAQVGEGVLEAGAEREDQVGEQLHCVGDLTPVLHHHGRRCGEPAA
jgi:hypothetical protein